MHRKVAGVPKVEVVGLSKEKVEELFWDVITRSGPTWRNKAGGHSPRPQHHRHVRFGVMVGSG